MLGRKTPTINQTPQQALYLAATLSSNKQNNQLDSHSSGLATYKSIVTTTIFFLIIFFKESAQGHLVELLVSRCVEVIHMVYVGYTADAANDCVV